MTEEEFEEKYDALTNMLMVFLGWADDDVFDEVFIIKDYIENNISTSRIKSINEAKVALSEAKEVLKIEPFPEDLIGDLTNTVSPIETRKEWLKGVVEKLAERIKQMEDEIK